MSNRTILKSLPVFALLLLALPTHLNANQYFNILDSVTAYERETDLRLNIIMKDDISENPAITFFKNYISIDFKNAKTNRTDSTFKISSSISKNATAYMVDNRLLRIKVATDYDSRKLSKYLSIIKSGNLFVLAFDLSNIKPGELSSTLSATNDKDQSQDKKQVASSLTVSDKILDLKDQVPTKKDKIDFENDTEDTENKITDSKNETFNNLSANANLSSKKSPPSISLIDDSLKSSFLKIIMVLAAIITFCYLLLFIFRKIFPFIKISETNSLIKKLGTISLGGKQKMEIVDIAGEVLVVAVANDNLSLISKIEDKEIKDRLRIVASKNLKEPLSIAANSKSTDDENPILNLLRIGKIKTDSLPKTLFDDNDQDTFAGKLSESSKDIDFTRVERKDEILKRKIESIKTKEKESSLLTLAFKK